MSLKVQAIVKDNTAAALKQIEKLTDKDLVSYTETFVEVARDESPIDTGHNRSSIAAAGSFVGAARVVVDGEDVFGGTSTPPGIKKGQFWVFTRSKYGGFLELFTKAYMQIAAKVANKEFLKPGAWSKE